MHQQIKVVATVELFLEKKKQLNWFSKDPIYILKQINKIILTGLK